MTNPEPRRGPQERTARPAIGSVSAGHLLLVLRRNHVPCSIDSFSAGGWTARLGDPAAGPYAQQGCFDTRQAAADWLLAEIERRGAFAVTAASR